MADIQGPSSTGQGFNYVVNKMVNKGKSLLQGKRIASSVSSFAKTKKKTKKTSKKKK